MTLVVNTSDQNEVIPTNKYPYAKFQFENFNPVQSRVFDFFDKETSAVIAAATSAGKAQPLTSLVLTPNGFAQMGQLKVGSEITGRDDQTYKVTGVFPQGKKLVYRVHFSDGVYADCCEDHLWAVHNGDKLYKILPLKEIRNSLKNLDGTNKWFIPLIEPKVSNEDLIYTDEDLWLSSCEKFIPKKYFTKNADFRLALLRKLMDTDGNINCGDDEYSSYSKQLAMDFCHLVRSLGGTASVREGKSSYVNADSILIERKQNYCVTVNLGPINPFSLPRKTIVQQVNLEKGRNRTISSIEEIGVDECQCISVDSPDQLYITNDFIVTHNTVCAEMFLAQELRKRGGKGMYLAPLKALANEKYDDWTDKRHHFGDLNISICSGDYRLTEKRHEELNNADLIIMTSEMLNHRARSNKSEKSKFLKSIGTLVVDESHLLTVPGRGDHLEAGLMKFTELNPNARLILLSATMPNVDEISNWVANILTQRDTFLIKSNYRPCPLNIHYEKYSEERTYEDNEQQKVDVAAEIVEYYPNDKFLIFTHTKRTGELMKSTLQNSNIKCEFHNADLTKEKRIKLEQQFKTDPKLRVIVATSTLAWGLNLPARRVIILGVHRGMSDVATYDIWQAVGRAGRPSYDPVGDAYILLPEKTYDVQKERLRKPQPIKSQMLDDASGRHKVLAFHLVAEIHQGNIKDKEGIHHWYKRSLAAFQSYELDTLVVDNVLDSLKKCGAIWEEDGQYTITSIGKIASLFYFSPFDVSDLKKNFSNLFDSNTINNDYCLSYSLGNTDTNRMNIVSKIERDAMSRYQNKISEFFGKELWEPAVKAGYAYYCLLNGIHTDIMAGFTRQLQFDFPRLNQVLQALDGFTGKWERKDWFNDLNIRISYGVKNELVGLCKIPNIGKVRAEKLYKAGIKNVDDFVGNVDKVSKITGLKKEKISETIAYITLL